MQLRAPLAFGLLIALTAGLALGVNSAEPTSARAVEGKKKFEQAVQTLQKTGDDAVATAKKQYVTELERVQRAAMSSANIVNANWTKTELARARAGDYAPTELPKVKLLAETREHFDRALDKAYVDLRPQFEAARRQYLSELEICKKIALSQVKDLEEANRIVSEIQRAGAVDLVSKEWVDLLATAHAADWDPEKDRTVKKRVPQQDGSILLSGFYTYAHHFADGRIHARVRKISGQNVTLILRQGASGGYAAYCNGGTVFGIGMSKEGGWVDLAAANSKPYDGMVDMEFVATGEDLVLWVGGRELIHIKDSSLTRGRAGIGAVGQAQMADLRLKITDGETPPSPIKAP